MAPPKIIRPKSREEWLQHRSRFLTTASRVASLLVPHPYASARMEYDIAIGKAERQDGDIDPDLQEIGDDAEMVMLARLPRLVPNLPPMRKNSDIYVHPTLSLCGTPDFLQVSGVGHNWQGKCVSPQVFRAQWMNGPPVHTLLQHQAEYLLSGTRTGGIILLVRDFMWTTMVFPVEPDERVMRAIELSVADLQKRVKERKPPKRVGKSDDQWILQNQTASGKFGLDLSKSNVYPDAFDRYMEASARAEAAATDMAQAKAEIAEMMGEADYAKDGSGRIVTRTMVDANPGKTITQADVGKTVGQRRGHVRMNFIREED